MKSFILCLVLLCCSYSLKLQSSQSSQSHEQSQNTKKIQKLLGSKMTLVEIISEVVVPYAYYSWGTGNNKKETYTLAIYSVQKLDDAQVLCFIQKGRRVSQTKKLNKDFQYGFNDDVIFFVEQDATRRSHNIYQWRFMQAAGKLDGVKSAMLAVSKSAAAALTTLYKLPISFEWMAGKALNNF